MSVMFDQWHGKSYKCHSPSSSLWARINQSNLLGAMSRRPKQLRRIRRQDYNGVSDGKYKVSVISGETVNGEHVLQDKSGSYTPGLLGRRFVLWNAQSSSGDEGSKARRLFEHTLGNRVRIDP